MKPDIKAAWLEALRSGEYQQGQLELKDAEGQFCCLGVLCDLYRRDKGLLVFDHVRKRPYEREDWPEGYRDETLPPWVVEWSGIVDEDPGVFMSQVDEEEGTETEEQHALSEWNDGNKTFKQIAVAIEEQL